jgi:hypothetical protein
VYLHELNWDDKELVLRLLFAKMNGSNANMNHAVQNTTRAGGGGKSKSNSPVFISEGKGLPTEDGGDFQEYFSIPGYTDDLGVPSSNPNYAIPMDQLNPDEVGYEFGEGEGSKVHLA